MRRLSFISIDPSLRNFGFAKGYIDIDDDNLPVTIELLHLEESATDKANAKVVRKNSDDLRRARVLCRATQQMIEEAQMVFVEVPVGSQSARSMASYGICIGVLAGIRKPMIQVTPSEVKLATVGSKTASKQEMIEWAVKQHPDANWLRHKKGGKLVLTAKNEHLADAVAVTYAAILTDQFHQAIAMLQSA